MADIHILLDRISDHGTPVAANRALAWLKVLCNWAAGRGLIETNPCNGISRPEPETPREWVLNDDELVALWNCADALGEPDLPNRIWTLPARRAKNGREHTIPLSELACGILEQLPQFHPGVPFVFTLRGVRPIQGHHLIKRRPDELLPSEMPPWTFHDIRRTVASGMASLGVNLPAIERLLNHVSGSFRGIVSVYQKHDFADEKRRAVELWTTHIAMLVTGETDGKVVRMHYGR